jgi:hypothetical protein
LKHTKQAKIFGLQGNKSDSPLNTNPEKTLNPKNDQRFRILAKA